MASPTPSSTSDFIRSSTPSGYWVSQSSIRARLQALNDIPSYDEDALTLPSPPPDRWSAEEAREYLRKAEGAKRKRELESEAEGKRKCVLSSHVGGDVLVFC
ncbi:hypothetical protein BT69DRAFT_935214 [Atractiella rhizophila]|nr:hypothetical protein BT69DRAFT_935214 [Atractiella rhizophila]